MGRFRQYPAPTLSCLSARPSGCVIWIIFDQMTVELGPHLWFGGEPGKPLPALGERVGKHSKGDGNGHKAQGPICGRSVAVNSRF
jgi:hypothetical protein